MDKKSRQQICKWGNTDSFFDLSGSVTSKNFQEEVSLPLTDVRYRYRRKAGRGVADGKPHLSLFSCTQTQTQTWPLSAEGIGQEPAMHTSGQEFC